MVRIEIQRVSLILLAVCAVSLIINLLATSIWSTPRQKKTNPAFVEPVKRLQIKTNGSQMVGFDFRKVLGEMKRSETSESQTVLPENSSNDKASEQNTEPSPQIIISNDQTKEIEAPQKNDNISICPEKPPHLEGPLANMEKSITVKELEAMYPSVEKGGRLRPRECLARERLAIIIPYRNRYSHLHILLHNLIPFLTRQQVDVTFFVIEQEVNYQDGYNEPSRNESLRIQLSNLNILLQAPPDIFNRGALLNIGFLEAEKIASFDCFIFHDVDLVPLNDYNFYRCGSNPRHYAVGMSKFNYRLAYSGYFGGAVGFSKKQYRDVNGNSNIYFGWGGEDDDLLARLRFKNYKMNRYDVMTARYDMIRHTRDKGNEDNPLREILLKTATQRQDLEGLNTTKYKVNSIQYESLYTWINVSLNMTEILQTAPEFTLNSMQKETALAAEKTLALERQKALEEKLKSQTTANGTTTVEPQITTKLKL